MTSDERPTPLLRFEPIILFAVIYLPGYLAQGTRVGGGLFNSVQFNLTYWLLAAIRIALILYVLILRGDTGPRTGEENVGGYREVLRDYGIVAARLTDFLVAVGLVITIEALLVPLAAVVRELGANLPAELRTSVHWRIVRPAMLPFVFVTSLAAGYSEELFFRAYLLTVLPRLGVGVATSVAASVLLFALGHLYEGALGLVGTAAIGILFAMIFLRRRNLHTIAVAHGLYNFLTLLLTLYAPAPPA